MGGGTRGFIKDTEYDPEYYRYDGNREDDINLIDVRICPRLRICPVNRIYFLLSPIKSFNRLRREAIVLCFFGIIKEVRERALFDVRLVAIHNNPCVYVLIYRCLIAT